MINWCILHVSFDEFDKNKDHFIMVEKKQYFNYWEVVTIGN